MNDVEECRARLDRAQKLIGGLGGEKDRWTVSRLPTIDRDIKYGSTSCLAGQYLCLADS